MQIDTSKVCFKQFFEQAAQRPSFGKPAWPTLAVILIASHVHLEAPKGTNLQSVGIRSSTSISDAAEL